MRFGADANCLPSPDVPSSLAVSRPAVSGWQLPLHIASTNGHLDVVKYLVQRAGANPCAVNNKGQTAAMYVMFFIFILHMLLECTAPFTRLVFYLYSGAHKK